MLKFKVKEVLLALDKRNPQMWLRKVCGFSKTKAANIVNNKQTMISVKDFTELCYQLKCTPNDLMYWQQKENFKLEDSHPCMQKLTPPDKMPEWKHILRLLPPEDVKELKALAEQKLEEKVNSTPNNQPKGG
jgi:DNA-binding Xre family transcriptional regulator